MAKIKCPHCGGKDFQELKECYACSSCGMTYFLQPSIDLYENFVHVT